MLKQFSWHLFGERVDSFGKLSERASGDQLACLVLVIVSLILVSLVRRFHFRRFLSMFDSFARGSSTKSLTREDWIWFGAPTLILTVNLLVVLATDIHFANGAALASQGLTSYLFLLISLMLVVASKFLINVVIGKTFMRTSLFDEINVRFILFMSISGVVLLPTLMMHLFNDSVSIWGHLLWGQFGLLYLFQLVRTTFWVLRRSVLSLHLFFYLCTLELAPAAVAFKWVSQGVLS